MNRLQLPESIYRQMLDHVLSCLPEEGCGLVGGKEERACLVIPVENDLHSPVRFSMEPLALLHGLETIENGEQELVAIFHSHPAGPPIPSETDVREFSYPGSVVLIWSPQYEKWQVRGFLIEGKDVKEVQLDIAANS